MKEKEILIGLLSKAYNLDPERIAELLYKKDDDGQATEEVAETALQSLLDLDVQRARKLKEDAKKRFDDGHKKGTSETASKWEKMLREKFAVDGEGESILEALAEKLEKNPGKGDLTDDAIKRHKLYRELELAAQKREEDALRAGEEKLKTYQLENTKAARRQLAESKAKDILLSLKPVLEDDATIADTRIRDFLRDLSEFEFDENLNPLKNGESHKNEHGHLVAFDQLAKEIAARRFKFQVQDPKGNGGNKNEPGKQPATPWNGQVPRNETELWQAYNTAPDGTARKAIMDAWEQANGAIVV